MSCSRVSVFLAATAMRRHGYKGAFEMAATVDYLFGYDATAGVMADWMYEQLTESYVLDLENRKFMTESNPWALHGMAERLLEATRRHIKARAGLPLEVADALASRS